MPWTDEQVERWVAELAAIDFTTPTQLSRPVPPDTFDRLLQGVASEQLSGMLVHAVQTGAVQLDAERMELVAAQHSDTMAQALCLEQSALAASKVLESADVHHVLLKGAALGHGGVRRPELAPVRRC